jgi:hypothetical protein
MTHITESTIESFTVEPLQSRGYEYVYAPDIAPDVKARLKVSVKRLLRKYGYPPDMQLLATETVLKQAEMIAEELVDVNNFKQHTP